MNSSLFNSSFSLINPISCFQSEAAKSLSNSGINYSSSFLNNNGLNFNSNNFSQNTMNGMFDVPAFSTVQTKANPMSVHQKSQSMVDYIYASNSSMTRPNSLFTVLQNAHFNSSRLSPSIHHHQATWNTSMCVDLSAPVLKESSLGLNLNFSDDSKDQSQSESSVSSATFKFDPILKIKSETSDSCDSSRLSDDEVDKVFNTKRIKKQNICGHHDKEHYAKGLCNHCYRRFGRNKKPWACSHQKLYANGLCQRCYTGKYKKQRAIERKSLANNISKLI